MSLSTGSGGVLVFTRLVVFFSTDDFPSHDPSSFFLSMPIQRIHLGWDYCKELFSVLSLYYEYQSTLYALAGSVFLRHLKKDLKLVLIPVSGCSSNSFLPFITTFSNLICWGLRSFLWSFFGLKKKKKYLTGSVLISIWSIEF